MAGYTFIGIQKYNTNVEMNQKFRHNERIDCPNNVDPELTFENIELVPLKEGQTYSDASKEATDKAIANGTMKHVRKNAVLGFQVLITLPREVSNSINVAEWGKDNQKWLEKKFGKDNIKHMVIHMDEPVYDEENKVIDSNIHIHAFIVPMNEKGRLCFKDFINGRRDLSRLQTEYADEIGKKYGMKRGMRESPAHQITRKKIYGRENATEVTPEYLAKKTDKILEPTEEERLPSGGFTPAYQKRVSEQMKELFTEEIQNDRVDMYNEKNRLQKEADRERNAAYRAKKKYKALQKELEKQLKEFKSISRSISRYINLHGSGKDAEKVLKTTLLTVQALEDYPDKDLVNDVSEKMKQLADYQEKIEEKEERAKEEKDREVKAEL